MTSCNKLKASYDFVSMCLPTPVVQWDKNTSSKEAVAKVAVLGILGMLGWSTVLIATAYHLRLRYRLLTPTLKKVELGFVCGSAGMVAALALRTLLQAAFYRYCGSQQASFLKKQGSSNVKKPEGIQNPPKSLEYHAIMVEKEDSNYFLDQALLPEFEDAATRADTYYQEQASVGEHSYPSYYYFDYQGSLNGIPTSCFFLSSSVCKANSRRLFRVLDTQPHLQFTTSGNVMELPWSLALTPTAFAFNNDPIYIYSFEHEEKIYRQMVVLEGYSQSGAGQFVWLCINGACCTAEMFGKYAETAISQMSQDS